MIVRDYLLLENGSRLLLEDGGKIIIGEREVSDGGSGGRGGHPWPQRTLNILMPKRVMQDDEDILLAIDD